MKAAILRSVGSPLSIEDVAISKPGPREVLIRTAATGVCHSDLHFYEGSYPTRLPTILGHESAGVVEAVFFVLMFGVAVAYLVALHDFVRATPLAMPLGVDVALAAAAAVPLALVDDFGSLAAAGAAALVALACSLAAIALYGVMRRERLGWAQSGTFDWTKPDSVADVGAAVGVMAFCFGVAPVALHLEASMAAPERFAAAPCSAEEQASASKGDWLGKGIA